MLGVSFLSVACAIAIAVDGHPLSNSNCIVITKGTFDGYEVQLKKTILQPRIADWEVVIPDIPDCNLIGVKALVCDDDVIPTAHFMSMRRIFVHRSDFYGQGSVTATAYCALTSDSQPLPNIQQRSSVNQPRPASSQLEYDGTLHPYLWEQSSLPSSGDPLLVNKPKSLWSQSPQPVWDESPHPVWDQSPHPVWDQSPHPVQDQSPHPVWDQSPHPVWDQSPHPARDQSPQHVLAQLPHSVSPLPPSDHKPNSLRRQSLHPVWDQSPHPVWDQSPQPVWAQSPLSVTPLPLLNDNRNSLSGQFHRSGRVQSPLSPWVNHHNTFAGKPAPVSLPQPQIDPTYNCLRGNCQSF